MSTAAATGAAACRLMFRYAWVGAGPISARDDRMVAEMARSRQHGD